MKSSTNRWILAAVAAQSLVIASGAQARLPTRLQRKVAASVRVLDDFTRKSDADVPEDMLETAECVAVLPNAGKGAFIVGGQFGRGLVSCRLPDRSWGPPVFIGLGGMSIGLQIGGQATDYLLIVRNREGIDYLLRDKFTLGADASVAAGPVGRTATAGTDIAMQAAILSYSHSRGAFAGVSLSGAVVKQDNDDTALAYGRDVGAKEILTPAGASMSTPLELKPYVNALNRHAPASTAHKGAEPGDK